MAKLSRKDVLNLARLSRLKLTDSEIKQFQSEISTILGYVEQLQSVKLDNIDPTYQVTGLSNVMRADKLIDYEAKPKDLIKSAPAIHDDHIKVNRMLT